MWVLFVLSFVIGQEEIKVTFYDEYKTSNDCYIEQAVLEANFTQGEVAICIEKKPNE